MTLIFFLYYDKVELTSSNVQGTRCSPVLDSLVLHLVQIILLHARELRDEAMAGWPVRH
jgi:hypothetical protein